MALLDRPLYGTEGTGCFGRVLAYRRTLNAPDLPGETVISMGTVCKIPVNSCRPTPAQTVQRSAYAAAVAAWLALSDAERAFYLTNAPTLLNGFNFFLRLYLLPGSSYFGFCLFSTAVFQTVASPVQPAAASYPSHFPTSIDDAPTLANGQNTPQAWLFQRIYDTLEAIEDFLILNKSRIEA